LTYTSAASGRRSFLLGSDLSPEGARIREPCGRLVSKGGISQVKRIHLSAIVVALTLALGSCGSDDSQDTSTVAAGTSTPKQSDQPPSGADQGTTKDATSEDPRATGSGGSSSSDADRAASQPATRKKAGSGSSGQKSKPKPAKPKTPEEEIAALSPSERRALHKDLYEQGKALCYAYGPKELAKSNNLTGSDPETIASQQARIYEAATPTLILPYQQGCLAGFRKFARNPPEKPTS
jgi:hypothetical protein